MDAIANPELWSTLLAVVAVNLALSGDNAVVIALAARKLPETLRRRTILLGTLGAVAVRAILTGAVLWALTLPGLSFAGGLLVACVAYRLLAVDGEGGGKDIAPASGFWGALRTIVVADAAMGLDNVLGVAGAAGGDLALAMAGLALSVPILVWGSTLILTSIQRFPALLYIGGTVLAWIAAGMLASEPLVREVLDGRPSAVQGVYAAVVGGTLGLAWLRNRRAAVRSQTEVLQ